MTVSFDDIEAQWFWARNHALNSETTDPVQLLNEATQALNDIARGYGGKALCARAAAGYLIRYAAIIEKQQTREVK